MINIKEFIVKRRHFLLLIGLFLIGCGGQDTNVATDISIPVSVEEVKPKPMEEFVTTTGTVNAMEEATLNSETAGYYYLLINKTTGKPFALGDFVKKGREIIRLDNPELENNIKIESQKLNLDISKREYEKQQSLYKKGGVTLRELINSQKAYKDAQYNYDYSLLQLAKLKIIVPFNGVIVELPYYTPGVKISTNMSMAQIMNYSKLYLDINLPGKDLGKMKTGQPVRLMNYSLANDTLNGFITQVSPAINPDTRSFLAYIEIANPKLIMRPGMFVKAEIIVARRDSALVIPKDIILSKRRGKSVFIVERGVARERIISTGLENPDEVEVVQGLKANDRLVVKGFETLRNRSKVKIIR
ncbi:MAG TPA: efflux RND transporter periplasmic adaptor subunit [Bacteroidetes bacterium]|nr:efflux RND transporter periplasmic adaptor subunit [Bacteroidota bacterium]